MSEQTIADVYGKYSLGSGAILKDADSVWNDLADPQVLASYEASMRRDMVKSGIALGRFSSWHVMDVGTGRQALTFLKFGAARVSHFDISPENCARVASYSKANNLESRLDTTCCDLVQFELGQDRFDFVYLNGIIQHFSDVGRGAMRCIRALKTGGYLWLYFYRSGTFDNFVLYMLRTLANGSNVVTDNDKMKEYFVNSLITYSDDVKKNYLSSIFMDGIFTRYARLYSAATYIKFAECCGCEIVSSSGLDPVGRDVDHYYARAATVLTLRKIKDVPDLAGAAALLSPDLEVDQLDAALYDDPAILRSLAIYGRVASRLSHPSVPVTIRQTVVMRLFHFLAHRTRQPDYEVMNRHEDLQACLEAIDSVLGEEYPLS